MKNLYVHKKAHVCLIWAFVHPFSPFLWDFCPEMQETEKTGKNGKEDLGSR